MFRRPLLGLTEIAWRWSVGLAAVTLFTFAVVEYLDTLPVSAGELLLLRSRQPALISQAIAHIFKGSAWRFVLAVLAVAVGLTLAWIVAAAFGRAAIVRALLGYFREITTGGKPMPLPFADNRTSLAPLLGLNFFRVVVTLAAMVGSIGALALAGSASSAKDPSPGSAALIFLMVLMLVWLAWSVVNWFLSLAAVFVVADGCDSFSAIVAAMDLCRTRAASVVAAGTWFGLAHIVAFFVATSVVAFPLALARVLPGGVVMGGVLLVTLLYFAVADFLYAGRLAAYVAIVELPLPPVVSVPPPPFPPDHSQQLSLELPSRVDQDEVILSDSP